MDRDAHLVDERRVGVADLLEVRAGVAVLQAEDRLDRVVSRRRQRGVGACTRSDATQNVGGGIRRQLRSHAQQPISPFFDRALLRRRRRRRRGCEGDRKSVPGLPPDRELADQESSLEDLDDLRWHFIGQAQTNKAAAIRRASDVVHSVDRTRLADALHRAASDDRVLDVLVQVNLTEDAGRGGSTADDAEALAEHVLGLDSLRLRGVMAVAPLDEEPAAAFARLRAVADRIRLLAPDARWISAGMTGDFVEAIQAGATHLRIGSAITGPRPDRG